MSAWGSQVLKSRNAVTRTARRCGGNQECQHNTYDAVNQKNDTAEYVQAASNTRKGCPEREVDQETGDDKQNHAGEVDPVGDTHRQRMRFTVVSQMCHLLHPPRAGNGFEVLTGGRLGHMHCTSGAGVEAVNRTQSVDRHINVSNRRTDKCLLHRALYAFGVAGSDVPGGTE